MNRTAYFHPAFAEELALLTPDARIYFYSQAMRDATSLLNLDRYCSYHPIGAVHKFGMGMGYFQITPMPKTCMSMDRKTMRESNLYLHLAVDNGTLDLASFDSSLIETSRARLEALKNPENEALSFHEFCEAYADRRELEEANRINIELDQRKFYRRMMVMAFDDTRKDVAALFNLTAPQMDRMLTRIDCFLENFDENLGRHSGGRLALEISFSDLELFSLRKFGDVNKEE